MQEARKNFFKALELHLSILREKAIEAVAVWVNSHPYTEKFLSRFSVTGLVSRQLGKREAMLPLPTEQSMSLYL